LVVNEGSFADDRLAAVSGTAANRALSSFPAIPILAPMPHGPTLPLLPDGTLPPLVLLVRWLEEAVLDGATSIHFSRLPQGNGSLPDLLNLCGIRLVDLDNPPGPRAFRWEGCGGALVTVNAPDQAALPLHRGHLPAGRHTGDYDPPALVSLVDLARLEDANATRGLGDGASWSHILAAAGMSRPPRLPRLASQLAHAVRAGLGAWNPLPFARSLVVALPMQDAAPPWGVIDWRGTRHPVQVTEGPLGREILVDLELGALAGIRLEPFRKQVPGGQWEVSRTVLDNGRVRAELDPLGQVVRLCWEGHFASLPAPAVQPLVGGVPLAGPATITVLEDGPVRARVSVIRPSSRGNLHLIYTLHAHEEILRVMASWDGADELLLDHPTAGHGGPLRVAGDMASWTVAQSASVTMTPAPPQRGVRWATLEGDDGGLAVVAGHPLTISARAGHLGVHLDRGAAYGLVDAHRRDQTHGLGRISLMLAVPGRAFASELDLKVAFRLQGAGGLVPWWVRRPADWAGELILGEQEGVGGSATFFPGLGEGDELGEAWRVDALGRSLARLPATPEGDGFTLDYAAGELLIVRWK
jgi:hypothetical protein